MSLKKTFVVNIMFRIRMKENIQFSKEFEDRPSPTC